MHPDIATVFAKHQTIKLLIAAGLLCVGLYLSSIAFLGQEWTSRAGCLITMLGIWSGLGGTIQERVLATRIRQKQRNAITRVTAELAEHDASEETVQAELAKIRESHDAQLAHAAEKLRLSVGFEEVSLVLAGTFIWGFGDLLWRL